MTGGLGLVLPLAWRNLWRNPRRTLITLAVVAVGMWSILAFDAMLVAFADAGRAAALRLLTGEAQIHARGYLDDPGVDHAMDPPCGALLALLNGPGASAWAPRVRVPAVIRSEYRTREVTLLGVSPADERRVSDLPDAVTQGRYLTGPDDAGLVLGRDLAAKLRTRIGKRVIVLSQAADGSLSETGYVVVGLFASTRPAEDAFVFMGLWTAQTRLGLGPRISEIALFAAPAGLEPSLARLAAAAPGLDVRSWTQLSPMAAAIESYSHAYVVIWLLIMFVLMAIGVVNTQLMAVFERTREFGLLLALGMRPGLILLQVAAESALLIALGVAAGCVMTAASLAPFAHGLDLGPLAPGAELAGIGRILYPHVALTDALRCSLAVWGLGLAAGLWPARVAARIRPALAMART